MPRAAIPTLATSTMTLSHVMSQAVQYLVGVKGYSPGTADQYDRTYRQFLAYLSTKGANDDVRSFTSEHVLGFATDLGARRASSNTIISKLAALSTLAQFALRLRDGRGRPVLAENPTKGFDWPEMKQAETKFLYPNELRAFLEVECPVNESVARDLLLDTGIRASEACEANVGDIVEIDEKVYLTVQVKGRRRQGEQKKHFPVSARVAEVLRDYLLARGMPSPVEPLFLNRFGRRWSRTALTGAMDRIGKKAGITRFSTSAHKLRHTVNVIARRAGLDPYTRSALLGHATTKTLARYDHLVPDELHEARERQEEALGRYVSRPRQPE